MDHLYKTSIKVFRRVRTGGGATPVYAWVQLYDTMATVNQLSAFKTIRNEGGAVVMDTQVYMKYVSDLTISDRVVDGTSVYDIQSIHDPNQMHHHLELTGKLMPANTLTDMGIGTGASTVRICQMVTISSSAAAGINLTMLYAIDITMVMVDATANATNGALRLRTGTTAISDAVTCAVSGVITVSEAITAAVKRTTVGKVLNLISTGDDATLPRGIVYIIGTPY
jgi:head-tail adaptor